LKGDSLLQTSDLSNGWVGRLDDCGSVAGRHAKAGEVAGTADCDVSDDRLEGSIAARALATDSGQPGVDGGDDRSCRGVCESKGCEETKIKTSGIRGGGDIEHGRSTLVGNAEGTTGSAEGFVELQVRLTTEQQRDQRRR